MKLVILMLFLAVFSQVYAERVVRVAYIGMTVDSPMEMNLYESSKQSKLSVLKEHPLNNKATHHEFSFPKEVINNLTKQKLSLNKHGVSEPISISDNCEKLFFSKIDGEVPQDLNRKDAMVKLEKEWKDILLVVHYNVEKPFFPAKFMVYSVGDKELKKGRLLFVNLSKDNLSGDVGTQECNMSTGTSYVIETSVESEQKSFNVSLDSFRDGKKTAPILRRVWGHVPQLKSVFIFYDDLKNARVTYSTFVLR